jgi:hypothetical protein
VEATVDKLDRHGFEELLESLEVSGRLAGDRSAGLGRVRIVRISVGRTNEAVCALLG